MKNLFTTSLLAIAGSALFLAPSAKALTYNDNDLMLGFRMASTAAVPATNDYMFNLGQYSALPTSGTKVWTLGGPNDIGNVALDLQTTFGANWFTQTGNSTVYFSVFGVDTNGNGTIYVGRDSATSLGTLSSANGGGLSADIQTVTFSDYAQGTATANSSVGWTEAVAGVDSYAKKMPGNGGPSAAWGLFNTNVEDTFAHNTDYLQVMTQALSGAVTSTAVKGYFSVSTNGLSGASQVASVTYAAPVPEPSTYASLALGAGLVAIALRRRTAKA